jgi:hypothetical protein
VYRLYTIGITIHSRSLLARIYYYIDIIAPDLPRAFLYTKLELILYSTTTKLVLLFKLIVESIIGTKSLGTLRSLLVAFKVTIGGKLI